MINKNELIKKLIKLSIMTGSRTMGVYKDASDWDYILSWKYYEKYILPNKESFTFINTLLESDYDSDLDFSGINCYIKQKLALETRTFNFIVKEKEIDYKAWKMTAKIIPNFPKFILKKRKTRLEIFHFLLNLFRKHYSEKEKINTPIKEINTDNLFPDLFS